MIRASNNAFYGYATWGLLSVVQFMLHNWWLFAMYIVVATAYNLAGWHYLKKEESIEKYNQEMLTLKKQKDQIYEKLVKDVHCYLNYRPRISGMWRQTHNCRTGSAATGSARLRK